MIAQFGMPGHIELLIIGMVGLALVGVPLIIVIVVLSANRRQQQSTECPKCGEMLPPPSFVHTVVRSKEATNYPARPFGRNQFGYRISSQE